MRNITTVIILITISVDSAIFSQESKSLEDKVYVDSNYFTWRAIYRGERISAYDFFVLTGYDEAAQKEKVFYNEQVEYHREEKFRLQSDANTSWGIWTTVFVLSSVLTALGVYGTYSTYDSDNYVGFGFSLASLSIGTVALSYVPFAIIAPINKTNRLNDYDSSIIYSTHSKTYAKEAADNYNNRVDKEQ